jgi:hypothetical protein
MFGGGWCLEHPPFGTAHTSLRMHTHSIVFATSKGVLRWLCGVGVLTV